MEKLIRCPICKKQNVWGKGGPGPFCSDRCRLIDLGAWLDESYSVSEPLSDDTGSTDDAPEDDS